MPALDHMEIYLDNIIPSRQENFRDHVRSICWNVIHRRCHNPMFPITRRYSSTMVTNVSWPVGMKSNKCHRIYWPWRPSLRQPTSYVKRAVAIFNDQQVSFLPHCGLITDQVACYQHTSAFATWDIIRQYADWPDKTLKDMLQLIDTPTNGFMLEHNYHNTFENFYWTLVPEVCWISISVWNRHADI